MQIYQSYYQGNPKWERVGKIVNNANWIRITSLLSSTRGEIILGGKGNEPERFIEPTVVINVNEDDSTVQGEIFGPVLPVIKYSTSEDAKRLLGELSPDALALYVFSQDLEEANKIINMSTTGSASINDCMAQIAPTSLPFGGFGKSGFGSYRGRESIETFSHKQSIVTVPTAPEFEALMGWRYPYAESMETIKFVKTNLEVPM
jgi:acyl-CoA reductase-like NAD-dependent aldehyde dehydrogenase